MKRIWAILLSIAIMMSLTVAAFAAEIAANTTNMNMTVVQDGKKITIELTNSKAIKFDTMTFHIDFETTKLTCTAVDYKLNGVALDAQKDNPPYVGNSTVAEANSTGTAGFYYCQVGSTEGQGVSLTAAGQLKATITFTVNDSVKDNDTYTVTLSEDSNGSNGVKETKTATLTFKGASAVLLGDVNGDGLVNAGDASLVLQHYAGTYTIADKYLVAADVNHDGLINAGDASLILQHYAGTYTIK